MRIFKILILFFNLSFFPCLSNHAFDAAIVKNYNQKEYTANDNSNHEKTPTMPAFNWHCDSRQMYHVKLKQGIDFKTSGKSPTRLIQEIDGILNFSVFNIEAEEVHLGFQLSPVSISFSGKRVQGLEEIYSTFFLATFKKTGKPLSFYFPNKIAIDDELVISEVIKIVQAILPGVNEETWSTEETHSMGKYVARYSMKEDYILKEKVNYISLYAKASTNKNTELKPKIIYSKFFLRPSKFTSWLESMTGKERLNMEMGNFMSTNATIDISMKMIPFKPDPTLDIWKEGRTFKEILASFKAGEKELVSYSKKKEMDEIRKRVQQVNLDTLILKFIDTDGKDVNQRQLLVDYIKVFPEEMLKIQKLLLQNRVSNKATAKIINTLGVNGTPYAQKALINIMKDESQMKNNRIQAARSLGGLKNPIIDVIDALWDVSKVRRDPLTCEISNTALFALGRISSEVKRENQSLSRSINKQLSDYLEQKSNDERQAITFLRAIENTGDVFFVKKLVPFIYSESRSVKKAAINVYSKLNDAHSLSILVKALAKEKSVDIRKVIVRTIMYRRPNVKSIGVIKRLLNKEKDRDMKRDMVKYLLKNKDKSPHVIKTIKK